MFPSGSANAGPSRTDPADRHKTAFDKPGQRAGKDPRLIRTQLKRIEEQGKYALFNDFFTYLWMAANFTINEENLKKL